MNINQLIENLTLEDIELLRVKKLQKEREIPSFSFSRMKMKDLEELVHLKFDLDKTIFNNWFNTENNISEESINFLKNLIKKTAPLLSFYDEEDLKVHFLTPFFLKIDFTSFENEYRDFYHEQITYKADKFILNGKVDFVLAKGLIESHNPYFFIQEFKRAEEYSNPRPQLLAELIAGLEISNFSEIKGAYVIGINWNFVILKKEGKDSYRYFVSKQFDSTKIEDLIAIYKNLVFIKNMMKEI